MASSSDWLAALLERPGEEAVDVGGLVKPLSWLAGPAGPKFEAESGFVKGLPFERPTPATERKTEVGSGIGSTPQPASSPDALPHDLAGEMTGDALVDILREALGENEETREAGSPLPKTASEPESLPEPPPDPIAQALARGTEQGIQQGRQEALAQAEANERHKLELRQTFRALDQAAMDALAGELGDTVIALCAQTLADYTPDAVTLQARCNDAARRLGSRISSAVLSLHPDDLALLDQKSLADWTVRGDPAAERGGLRFETDDGSISDRPSDWRRAIAAAIRG